MHVLDVITHLQLKMHIVEHSRRNWLSDAPEGVGGGGGRFFSKFQVSNFISMLLSVAWLYSGRVKASL